MKAIEYVNVDITTTFSKLDDLQYENDFQL